MIRKGILLNETGDLEISVKRDENGLIESGLQVVESDYQNISLLIQCAPGDFKEHPALGVGIGRYIKSTAREQAIKREIALQLSLDKYENASVKFENEKLTIEL